MRQYIVGAKPNRIKWKLLFWNDVFKLMASCLFV